MQEECDYDVVYTTVAQLQESYMNGITLAKRFHKSKEVVFGEINVELKDPPIDVIEN